MYKPDYKPLWVTMAMKDKKKNDLRKDLGMSSSTISKMVNNQFVAMSVIAQLCDYLSCNIEEVVQMKPGE
ncbi:helix-turn-helix transcriptional regulator [Fictibacillus nanhaiensis]|uniref:helix-turn-helix domain-containing protein n=1 Tax=Fictibacillus nanhaiensis TaxID=742169 RepID=UPI002E1D0432|nr:helix-turn-helix transcriptional regulator [Fictibacillus nanhaiensis]